MKQIYSCIIFCLLFGTNSFSSSVTVRIDSTKQVKRTITLQKCDTLIVIDPLILAVRLSKDTLYGGNADFSRLITPKYVSGDLDTFIFIGLDTFKALYIALTTAKVYFKVRFRDCDLPSCSSRFSIRHDSVYSYTFIPIHTAPDSNFVTDVWTINGDTISTDSITHQSHFTFDSSGTYQVCLHASDSLYQCSFDTCKILSFTFTKYIPLLDSINDWHLYFAHCYVIKAPPTNPSRSNCIPYYSSNEIDTKGDTLIDSIKYKQVVFHYAGYYGQNQSCLWGFIREDTGSRKVYYRRTDSIQEHILYDFSMLVGDSIPLHFENNGQQYFLSGTYYLDSVKYVLHDSVQRKIFYLSTRSYYYTLNWIEGLGFLGHPFYLYSENRFGCGGQCKSNTLGLNWNASFSSAVTCFSHMERVYFDTCLYNQAATLVKGTSYYKDSCTYYQRPIDIHEIPSLSSFTLSPNPATDYASIELEVKQSDEFSIIIQNLEGQQIGQEVSLGWLQSGIQTKTIRLPDISSGIYLVGCKTKEGTLYRKLAINR